MMMIMGNAFWLLAWDATFIITAEAPKCVLVRRRTLDQTAVLMLSLDAWFVLEVLADVVQFRLELNKSVKFSKACCCAIPSHFQAFALMTDVPPSDVFEKYFFPRYRPPDGAWPDASLFTASGRLAVATLFSPIFFGLRTVYTVLKLVALIVKCLFRLPDPEDAAEPTLALRVATRVKALFWYIEFADAELLVKVARTRSPKSCSVFAICTGIFTRALGACSAVFAMCCTRKSHAPTDEEGDGDRPLCGGPSGIDGCSGTTAARPSSQSDEAVV
mmetsp:Transcript_25075/g.99738  ORF Transcript_25075/g.99738 Transcript_25075/m.99738 type:complete len:274 (-) Transcript_25075:227-1048(-)